MTAMFNLDDVLDICQITKRVKLRFYMVDKLDEYWSAQNAQAYVSHAAKGAWDIYVEKGFTCTRMTHIVAHELRHVWQYVYGFKAVNVVELPNGATRFLPWAERPQEIDAEAFVANLEDWQRAEFRRLAIHLMENGGYSYGY
jgi:hypothetical protein